MSTTFHRLTPAASHMATEPVDKYSVLVLCVECGWEAVVTVPKAPWVVFKDHPCRLVHTTTGRGW